MQRLAGPWVDIVAGWNRSLSAGIVACQLAESCSFCIDPPTYMPSLGLLSGLKHTITETNLPMIASTTATR